MTRPLDGITRRPQRIIYDATLYETSYNSGIYVDADTLAQLEAGTLTLNEI